MNDTENKSIKVLSFIKKKRNTDISEITKNCHISESLASDYLSALRKKGFLHYENGRFFLNDAWMIRDYDGAYIPVRWHTYGNEEDILEYDEKIKKNPEKDIINEDILLSFKESVDAAIWLYKNYDDESVRYDCLYFFKLWLTKIQDIYPFPLKELIAKDIIYKGTTDWNFFKDHFMEMEKIETKETINEVICSAKKVCDDLDYHFLRGRYGGKYDFNNEQRIYFRISHIDTPDSPYMKHWFNIIDKFVDEFTSSGDKVYICSDHESTGKEIIYRND